MSDILLASAAIPGAFPPLEIQGRLYADGGIASNFFYGGPMEERDTFGATWRRLHPDAPVLKTRYWVITNKYIELHLYALAEATKLRGDGDVEVHWVAVPQTWKPINDEYFDQRTMRSLSDEGRRLGSDPNSWNTKAP